MESSVRILYLEDDRVDARLIREQLRKSLPRAELTVAGSRDEFEALLANGGFDVVLSDYHVPRFNGLEALELVRRSDSLMPFIVVTGALGDERAIELLRSGATDVVLKDRLARLAPAIERALTDAAGRREYQQAQQRLARIGRLTKLAAEAARLGTWQFNADTGELDCSDEFLELIGVERQSWKRSIDALRAVVHPEDLIDFQNAYLDGGKRDDYLEFELRIRRPNGEVRWMHLRGDRLTEAATQADSFVGVMMDITERKRSEEALRDADRRKDEFLAVLAHELRNPLAPIYNGLSVLRQSPGQSAESERLHEMLERQMKHLVRLVDDLLDVSRITLGKIELKKTPVLLQAVLQSAVEMTRALVESADHRLEVSLPDKPVSLNADSARLIQVFANLLNNAARYTKPGGRIWVSAQVVGQQVTVTVRDNGIGIAGDMLERVFELFTQVEGAENRGIAGGLGIGLAMARKLIALHGGDVRASSAGIGCGSQFVVRLPLSESRPLDDQSEGPSKVSLSGRRVMVVDDNCDSADSLTELLRLAGAEAHAAHDGRSALRDIPLYQPDVVLLDLAMPGMSGYAVASQLRKDPRYRDLTLVALSGFGREQDRQRALAAGFDHHLAKPIDVGVLEHLLASLQQVGRVGRDTSA